MWSPTFRPRPRGNHRRRHRRDGREERPVHRDLLRRDVRPELRLLSGFGPGERQGHRCHPEASADTATTDYATPVTIDVLGKDAPATSTYPLDPSTLTLIDASGNAVSTLTVSGGTYKVVNGKIVFTPAAKFTGTDGTVMYQVADTLGNTASSTVTVTVKTVKPTAANDTATTEARTPVTVDVLANDAGGATDLPLDPTTLKLIDGSGNAVNSVNVAGGTYSVVSGKVVFTPDANFTGTAPSVRYEVSDELGNTVGATVTVAVSPLRRRLTPTVRRPRSAPR